MAVPYRLLQINYGRMMGKDEETPHFKHKEGALYIYQTNPLNRNLSLVVEITMFDF